MFTRRAFAPAYRRSVRNRRLYSTGGEHPTSTKSAHAQFYSDLVPAMIPVAILGSAVYLGLQLAQSMFSHEKYLEEARARIRDLEAEVETLREERTKASQQSGPAPRKSTWW
ncbi:hypothetical protein PLICRDRAFT_97297 [Plicaturopsis crispa FD-325 SS-3]|nr:hypothetical protein PLICRDRAFT_97297 [Plicaturopsis crispa FD-325 SS-3]